MASPLGHCCYVVKLSFNTIPRTDQQRYTEINSFCFSYFLWNALIINIQINNTTLNLLCSRHAVIEYRFIDYLDILRFQCTLPGQKTHTLIFGWTAFCFEHWAHLITHIRQPYTTSQHLYTSRVTFIFGRDFVLMTGESNRSFSLFQHILKTFNGVKSGLWWPIYVWKWLLMLPDTHVSSCPTLSQLQPEHC